MKRDKLLEEVTRLYDVAIAKWRMTSDGTLSQAYYDGESNGIDLIKSLIIQLDEPEKVVIPQFVADEFDYNKNPIWEVDEAKNVAHILRCAFGNESKPSDFLDWVRENPEDYVMAVKNGFEVEKEPLYYIPLGVKRAGQSPVFLLKTLEGVDIDWSRSGYIKDEENAHLYRFTESEIKEINPNYWPFAEPVEESP